MKQRYYTWQDLETAASAIANDMYSDSWRPDYVVGVTRGGLPLALLLSHRLEVRMETLKVKLREPEANESCESNLWMAEDALGYNYPERSGVTGARWDTRQRKNILVVDDINNTGATFNWIKQDWMSSCLPRETDAWNSVWGSNVRFAVMVENHSSKFNSVSYYWDSVNHKNDHHRIVYPWEQEAWLKPSMV